jgi:hypothetical protein
MNEASLEFIAIVDEIYGMYLDSTYGFRLLENQIINIQKKSLKLLGTKASISEMDTKAFIYGKGSPYNPLLLHKTTQGDLKNRNIKNGSNYKTIANLTIVLIYQYWEDTYRDKISQNIGITKNDIKSDVFSDLRLMRQCIIHHKGVVTIDYIKKILLYNWFTIYEEIQLNENQVLKIINDVKHYLNSF